MAKVEIDEAELQQLQRVAKFANTALNNPKTRTKILAIEKELNPEVAIPEIDAAAPVMDALKAVTEQVQALGKRLDERNQKSEEDERTAKAQKRLDDGRSLLSSRGYNAEGIKKIEDLMLEKGIGDYDAARIVFETLNPPPSPADASRSRFGSMSDNTDIENPDRYKSLWESQGKGGQAQKWLDDEINATLRDVRTNSRH